MCDYGQNLMGLHAKVIFKGNNNSFFYYLPVCVVHCLHYRMLYAVLVKRRRLYLLSLQMHA